MLKQYRYLSIIIFIFLLSIGSSKKAITRDSEVDKKKIKKPSNKKKYQRLPKLATQDDLDRSIQENDFVFVFFYDSKAHSNLEAMTHLLKIKRSKFFKKSKVSLTINII
jgi:hypothetical protein